MEKGRPRRLAGTCVSASASMLPREPSGEVRDPGAGGLHSLRVCPGARYRLPGSALSALVSIIGRDLLLRLASGGMILLRDLISVETMGNPPVLEFGEHDLSAHVVAVLGLASDGRTTMDVLVSLYERPRYLHDRSLSAVLAKLRRDGVLPQTPASEWNLL